VFLWKGGLEASDPLAIAMALGLVKGLQWYGGLLREVPQHVRFIIGFALTTTTVGAVELFGFNIIWRMLLASDMASARIDSTGRG
jgi:hypothetical protein